MNKEKMEIKARVTRWFDGRRMLKTEYDSLAAPMTDLLLIFPTRPTVGLVKLVELVEFVRKLNS